MATVAMLLLLLNPPSLWICGVEVDLTSLCGSGRGDCGFRGEVGEGVTERKRVEGREVREGTTLAQLLAKEKLKGGAHSSVGYVFKTDQRCGMKTVRRLDVLGQLGSAVGNEAPTNARRSRARVVLAWSGTRRRLDDTMSAWFIS